ncbi:uncharacterized protein METZ01_LOCUS40628, partial [marine metagenome]
TQGSNPCLTAISWLKHVLSNYKNINQRKHFPLIDPSDKFVLAGFNLFCGMSA